MKIKTIIADDHPVFRKGLREIIGEDPDIEIIAEASDGLQLLQLLETIQPHVVLIDIHMPKMDGLVAGRQLKRQYPHIHLIALSMSGEEGHIQEMLGLGAKGYLLKCEEPGEMAKAVKAVYGGGSYYSRGVLETMAQSFNSITVRKINLPRFTEKEVCILEHICQGLTGKEISSFVGLAERTVEHYIEKMKARIGAKNTAELAAYAVRHHLVNQHNLL